MKGFTFIPLSAATSAGVGSAGTGLTTDSVFAAREQAIETIGTGKTSSILMAPLFFIAKNVSSVPIILLDEEDEDVTDQNQELLQLIDKDKIYMLAMDYSLFGNAFLEIIRNSYGGVGELVYRTPHRITPKGPNSLQEYETRLDHYEYRTASGVSRKIAPEDVVHFKLGVDPNLPLLGLSPLAAMVQEVASDIEAGRAVAAVLKNKGMVGTFISPKPNEDGKIQEVDLKKLQEKLDKSYTSVGRGKAFATNMPIDVKETIADINKLALQTIRGVSEERVCAVLGIPISVIGFGSGLRTTKVGATAQVHLSQAWENSILPTLDDLLATLTRRVIEDELPPNAMFGKPRYAYKLPETHVSQSNLLTIAERVAKLYQGPILTQNEARAIIGYPPIEQEQQQETEPGEQDGD